MKDHLICMALVLALIVVVCCVARRCAVRDTYRAPDTVYYEPGTYGAALAKRKPPPPVKKHYVHAYKGTGYGTQNIKAAKNYSGALDTYPPALEVVGYECKSGVCVPKRGGKLSRRRCLECCDNPSDPC